MSKRMPNLASPFAKARNKAVGHLRKPFSRVSRRQLFWAGFVFLSLSTAFLINNPFSRTNSGEYYREGDPVRESIISPADINVTDIELTDEMRQTARDRVNPIFTVESGRADLAVQIFRSSWERLQRHGEAGNSNTNSKVTSKEDAKGEVHWTGAGGPDVGKVLAARAFSMSEVDAVVRALRESADGMIYNDSDRQYFQNEIALIDRQKPNQQSQVKLPESSWTALSSAREKLKQRLAEIKSLSEKEQESFDTALEPLIQPTVTYDSAATASARAAASQAVAPVVISLKRSESIAKQGDTVTGSMLARINAVRRYSNTERQWSRFAGLLFLVAAFYWIAWRFIEHRGQMASLTLSPERTFALFGFVMIIQTVLMSLTYRLAEFTAAQNTKPPLGDPTLWALAIPFAFTSLLITLLADRRIALFSGMFASLLAGLLAPKGLEFILYAAISSAVAVYGIGRYRSRGSVTIAGVLVGLINALVGIALLLYTQQPFILNTVLLTMACGMAGGLITAAVTSVFLPVCESLFGILTDVKLLELSNADLPILGQLALRAPGTNQHSHAVGQLAQEACRAVDANPLLARIGALYHDIGKLAAPEHFVENQLGRNPHDRLKPVQSAKIIISHVTYGQKLARELGLPQRIIDFIPQHHGTRTLHYFLRKAQTAAGGETEIEESDFRYPGPKPQFKEAAIMMISDSCEAAARSLSHPSPDNIRFIITKIIDAILVDDQLDECDLTLKELTIIRESLIKSLVAIYHSRVDYPGFVPPATLAQDDSEERGLQYENPAEIPISVGGEVEDEAIDRTHPPDKAEAKVSR
jgi:cyclic-di-AMP phosphodiesterase PgpH